MAMPPHDHGHDHSHLHHRHGGRHADSAAHPPSALAQLGFALAAAMVLNLGFVAIECVFGFVSNSMALLADAGHNFSDVLGLTAAWAANILGARGPSARYTYGFRSSSILAALLNAIILLLAVGGIVVEAIQRLLAPAPVGGATIIVVASAGIVVNGVAALLLSRGHRADLNAKSAFIHMLGDVGVNLGVAVSGAVILFTGWLRLDPIVSLAIAAAIVVGTWRLLRQSLDLALQAVPHDIDPAAVRDRLAKVAGVAEVHDLHIWPMSTTATALTCHLVMPGGHPGDAALADIAEMLRKDFTIEHATIQVETGDPEHPCVLVPDHVV